jgi:hypothetical protein
MTILLLLECFPWGTGTAACGAHQYTDTGGVEEGQFSICVLSSQRKYPFPYHKRKTIIFMVGRKKGNNWVSMRAMAGSEGGYGRKKGTC